MISISSADFNAQTVNLTTEGAEDWLTPGTASPSTTLRVLGAPHKLLGGRLLLYFDWANPGGTGFTQAMGITRTSLAADTSDGSAINTTTGCGFVHASILDLGWRLRAPANEHTRRLRIYSSHFSSLLTLQARLDGITTVATFDSGAAAVARRQWTIDYASNVYGAELTVACNITVGHGSTPNILFGAATLQRL